MRAIITPKYPSPRPFSTGCSWVQQQEAAQRAACHQHRQRVRKYLTLMSFRIPALILAALAYSVWHNGLISLAIIVASIPLPWMAVLIANDRPPRRAEEPRRYDSRRRIPLFPTAERPAIGGATPVAPQHGSDGSDGDVPR